MSWYNPFSWGDESASATQQRENVNAQAGAAGNFANQGEYGYNEMGAEAAARRRYLEGLARGENSIAQQQLKQGLATNLAQQRSMAASASPANAAMAARTAAMNAGRATSGMAGQAAMAGIAERQAAESALRDMILQQRGQDLQAALGSRQTAVGAYTGVKPEGSFLDKWGGAISGGISAISDRRLKKDVEDGGKAANKTIAGLKSYLFNYKKQEHGKGRQLGVMAQDLERAGLKHAVIDTPAGKVVHGAKLATANTALLAELGKRVSKLEGKGK